MISALFALSESENDSGPSTKLSSVIEILIHCLKLRAVNVSVLVGSVP